MRDRECGTEDVGQRMWDRGCGTEDGGRGWGQCMCA